MSLDEKKEWLLLMYSIILYLSLTYIKKLLLFLNIDFAHMFSSFILYGGIVIFVITLGILYHLKKKYATPNAVILNDKQVLILFIIIIVLGLGNLIM
ncbi:hypothetical protein SAMN05446037_103532 [Anaerovirgula multivorans]|uniref:Uncharacterized protein n=1 Tax=Anaerovirgula multivorans TaxID=312168 RepID=A0A239JIY8_9FIRM|nr:hypothetical protein [Anaerovirgula multivorans]SNT04704.1 hypothetical protein SAMN05446037_103532 [Anaerovirgula multivorans]